MEILVMLATLKVLNRNFVRARNYAWIDPKNKEAQASAEVAANNYFGAVRQVAGSFHVDEVDLAWKLCFNVVEA